jgi:hypothetical protein
MRSQTKVGISLALLAADLIFFLVIRQEFPVIYSLLIFSEIVHGIALIVGFSIAIITAYIIISTIYNEARKVIE